MPIENKLADDIWKEAIKYFVDLHKTNIAFSSGSLAAFTALIATIEVKNIPQIGFEIRFIVITCFILAIMLSGFALIRCISVMSDGRDPSDSFIVRIITYLSFACAAIGVSLAALSYLFR